MHVLVTRQNAGLPLVHEYCKLIGTVEEPQHACKHAFGVGIQRRNTYGCDVVPIFSRVFDRVFFKHPKMQVCRVRNHVKSYPGTRKTFERVPGYPSVALAFTTNNTNITFTQNDDSLTVFFTIHYLVYTT